jgi:hypothetical protein
MANANKFHSELKEWSGRHIGTTDENLEKMEIKYSPTTKKHKVGKKGLNGKTIVKRPKKDKKYSKVEIPASPSYGIVESIDSNCMSLEFEPLEVKACLALVESNSNVRLTKRNRIKRPATFIRRIEPDISLEYTPKKRVPNEIRRKKVY